jgi:hypothetical protein
MAMPWTFLTRSATKTWFEITLIFHAAMRVGVGGGFHTYGLRHHPTGSTYVVMRNTDTGSWILVGHRLNLESQDALATLLAKTHVLRPRRRLRLVVIFNRRLQQTNNCCIAVSEQISSLGRSEQTATNIVLACLLRQDNNAGSILQSPHATKHFWF